MEDYDVDSSKFPSVKIAKFVSSRIPSSTRRWQENNGAVLNLEVAYLTWTCTLDANNFAPNEFREVVNLSGLVVYKGSNTKGK